MEYVNLGRSGLKVSRISLGSWLTLGTVIDRAQSDALVAAAVERGVSLLDTADIYNFGEAERALGLAIQGLRRENLVIASKCYFPMSDDPNDRGLSRKHVFESVHGSLRRLQTDYLDLYQCHRPDPDTPVEETAMAMDNLIRQGKVLYWGVSYWPAHSIVEAARFCRAQGFHPPISNQPPYNLLARGIEDEVIAVSESAGVRQIVFSPLAQGVLSGKYSSADDAAPGSRAGDDRINQFIGRYLTADNLQRVAGLVELARELDVTPAQVALAWCLRLPQISSVIVGARDRTQLEENLGALDVTLDRDALARLDALFPGPPVRDLTT